MNILLAIFSGVIIAVMITMNGDLAKLYGNYNSTILIHIVGFISIILVLILKKSKIGSLKGIPLYLYSAGAIGVFTVFFNNIGFAYLGVSIPLAIGLFGQTITSIIIDQFGLLGMEKVTFHKKKYFGLFLIITGITVMMIF